MKKNLCLIILLSISAAIPVERVMAVPMLTLDAPDRVSAGSNFEVTIGISGLDAGLDLGAFSFDFYFTPKDGAAWLPHTTSFGDQLGNPDPYAFETIVGITQSDVGFNTKKLEIYEVSLLWDLSWQTDDFALITIGMYAVGFEDPWNRQIGVMANNFVLADANGDEFYTSNSQVGKFIVFVPEPTVFSLMVLALFSVGFAKGINRDYTRRG